MLDERKYFESSMVADRCQIKCEASIVAILTFVSIEDDLGNSSLLDLG